MPPRHGPVRYPIRTAARLSGLSTDTIRVWERRYRAVEPSRSDGGARFYSDGDLARLTLLRRAVESGHAIRHIAQLSDGDLRKLLGHAGAAPLTNGVPVAPSTTPGDLEPARNRFLEALERFDLFAAQAELQRVAAFATPLELAVGMIGPLMTAVGERWEAGSLRIAHEHAASAAVRSLLGTLLQVHGGRAHGPAMLAATLDGELHEIGVLLAAVLAASHGWRVSYLGPSVPAEDLVVAARTLQPRAVAISLAWPEGNEVLGDTVAWLRSQLSHDIDLWIGGSGFQRIDLRLPPRCRRIEDLLELDRLLAETPARR